MLFAQGSRFGGHTLYIKDNRLHYVYDFVGMIEQQIAASEDLPTGENVIVSAAFVKDGEDPQASPPESCRSTTAIRRSARPESKRNPGRSA